MKDFQSLSEILRWQAEQNPESAAILAPHRKPLTFKSLYQQVERTVKCLNAMGIEPRDRVAIVLPNGPEMATAFLGVASCATSAPLNPSYRGKEFDFYLSDLNAKALIVQSDIETPARGVALKRGIPILELSASLDSEAGIFSISGVETANDSVPVFSLSQDEALVLHTSGTTSKPKIVPLTHRNICTSAQNIKTTLQLTEQDCCLNIMPLFHIHGLMAAVLSSLSAGASVVCTPGFQQDGFFDWLSFYQPSWYTAVPTMHQTILAKAELDPGLAADSSIRFIRSSSSALPPQLMKGLENVFNAPVIESYGMTEAAHQMSSNPLPPLDRRPGSVGIAAGPEVGIMDETGQLLSPGETGEIVIRGKNVTLGYENNPNANETAFTDGWFRTGDQGLLDQEGYLTISGRLKEIVNRGGEKIAPREIDEVLLDHPSIALAVAFAVPHPTLGEDLAAAVVLSPKQSVTEEELRAFAFSHLADFKVPSQIVIVDKIPKGPTGKLQRIGLAEKLSSQLNSAYHPPRTEIEKTFVAIWETVLKSDQIGIRDNFFALGGDSLLAASVLKETEKQTSKELELSLLFRAPTIEQICKILQGSSEDKEPYLVPLQPTGSIAPLFLFPGHGGDIFTFTELAKRLDPERPVYVFRFPEDAMKDDTVANAKLKDMAASYVEEIIELQSEGPYHIAGHCFGGYLAFEIAHQLHAMGKSTAFVAVIFLYLQGAVHAEGMKERIAFHIRSLYHKSFFEKLTYFKTVCGRIIERGSRRFAPTVTRGIVPKPTDRYYFPQFYSGTLTLIDPQDGSGDAYHDPYMGWRGLAAKTDQFSLPGSGTSILQEPHVEELVRILNACLEKVTPKQ